MSTFTTKSSPPKFQAMAWAQAVRLVSDMSDTAIEKNFMSPGCCKVLDGRLKTPGLFTKYADGKSAPTHARSVCGGEVFVRRLEKEFPGTSQWLRLHLWKIIDGSIKDLSQIWSIMIGSNIDNLNDFFCKSINNRRVRTGVVTRDKLLVVEKSANEIEILTFLLCLLKEAEIRLDVRVHRMTVTRIISIMPRLNAHPVIKGFAGILFDYLEINFFRVIYSLPDHEGDMCFKKSWRDFHRKLSTEVYGSIKSRNVPSKYRLLIPQV